MKRLCISTVIVLAAVAGISRAEVQVVTTLPDYATFAEAIGGDRVYVDPSRRS